MTMMTAGVDAGTTSIKATLLVDGEMRHAVADSPLDPNRTASRLLMGLLDDGVKMKDLDSIIATGQSRRSIKFAKKTVTEVSALAKGTAIVRPSAGTVIDIGAQGVRVVHIGPGGEVKDFALNTKCSAGTGSFLEVTAEIVGVPTSQLDELAADARDRSPINAMCTVFAESEVVSLVARGVERSDIVAGLHQAMVRNLMTTVRQKGTVGEVLLCGGVVMNTDVVKVIGEEMGSGVSMTVAEEPLFIGSLGAAALGGR